MFRKRHDSSSTERTTSPLAFAVLCMVLFVGCNRTPPIGQVIDDPQQWPGVGTPYSMPRIEAVERADAAREAETGPALTPGEVAAQAASIIAAERAKANAQAAPAAESPLPEFPFPDESAPDQR